MTEWMIKLALLWAIYPVGNDKFSHVMSYYEVDHQLAEPLPSAPGVIVADPQGEDEYWAWVCGPRAALGHDIQPQQKPLPDLYLWDADPMTVKSVTSEDLTEQDVAAAQPSTRCLQAIIDRKQLGAKLLMVSRVVRGSVFTVSGQTDMTIGVALNSKFVDELIKNNLAR